MPKQLSLRVLQLRSEFRDNGPDTQALTLGKELRARGHSVVFAASGGVLVPEILRDGFEFFEVETLAVSRRSIRDILKTIYALRKILRREKPDVIHAHNAASIMLVALAARMERLRPALVQSVRGMELRPGYQWRNWIYRINPAALLAVSAHTKEMLVAAGASSKRVHVTFNGADVRRFDPDSVDKLTIRKEFGLLGKKIVGHVGNFSGWKGQDILVRALSLLKSSQPTAHIVLVGDGPDKARVENLAAELGVSEQVTFAGFRRDIPEMQAAFDLYAQPSTQGEMFPNAIVEAMAMGNSWVGSDLSGLSELTVDGAAGDVLEPGNINALAKTIGRRISNTGELRDRGLIARKFVLQNLTVGHVTDRVLAVYLAGLK